MKQQMYPWQEECLETWLSHDGRGIVRAVTGSGKTTLAIAAIEKLHIRYGSRLKVKIVVPQIALAAQWAQALRDNGGCPRDQLGFYYGGRKERDTRFCMIYVINSARYSLARHILQDMAAGNHVLLIADECHHYASTENRKIFDFLPYLPNYHTHYMAMGLSATPDTLGFQDYLVPALGREIYQYTFEDASRHHTISPFVVCNVGLRFDREEAEVYQNLSDEISVLSRQLLAALPALKKLNETEFFHALRKLSSPDSKSSLSDLAAALLFSYYQRRSVVYNAKAREKALSALVKRLDPSAKILIFSERITQAQEVCKQLEEMLPGQVGIYHSKMEKAANLATLSRYRNGEVRILVTCKALDEGLDVPQTSVGIVLSSTQTERQRIQRLGRILRKTSQNQLATLYYFFVEQTTDPYTYMMDFADTPVKTLFFSYITEEDNFIHPLYEDLAGTVLSQMILEGADREAQMEFRRCITQGLCRTDWLLEEGQMEDNAKHSTSVKERNYWLCMKMLRREDLREQKLL